jgi:hypothetical protein
MDKIRKFLESLLKKERKHLETNIFPEIFSLDLKNLDIKKLKNYPIWRVKYKKIRILFAKTKNKEGIIIRVDFRKEVYKNLP